MSLFFCSCHCGYFIPSDISFLGKIRIFSCIDGSRFDYCDAIQSDQFPGGAVFASTLGSSRDRSGYYRAVQLHLSTDGSFRKRLICKPSNKMILCSSHGALAQLDRVPDFESGCQGFESLTSRHQRTLAVESTVNVLFLCPCQT